VFLTSLKQVCNRNLIIVVDSMSLKL